MLDNLPQMTKFIPKIRQYDDDLEKQNLWWTVVAMVGKVNNQDMDGQLLESITETQAQFEKLRANLIENMVQRYLDKVSVSLKLKSQAFINTLNRNLFERTADVGFLAIDDDIVGFLEAEDFSKEKLFHLQERLTSYVLKYSVYDDVAILSPTGKVLVREDKEIAPIQSHNDIWSKVVTHDGYIEYDKPLDIFPKQSLPLSYLQRICNRQGKVVGILCLSFKFVDELTQLSDTLSHSAESEPSSENFLLCDQAKNIMFAKHSTEMGKSLPALKSNQLEIVSFSGRQYFAYVTEAEGYQGFKGLPWQSVVLHPLDVAFKSDAAEHHFELNETSALFPHDLNELNLEINTALLIVVLNGKIISLKNKVKAFLPVLDSFQEIGEQIRQIFATSIEHIYQVTHQTLAAEVSFLAKLAMDIMDRNLYERANDCRWWSVNPNFRRLLSLEEPLTHQQRNELTDVLKAINELYTVYENIIIFDKNADVVAMSDSKNQKMLGSNIGHLSGVKAALKLQTPIDYRVSAFEKTPLYQNKPTYIYYASIAKPISSRYENVGGVGVVFNAEPEFKAILEDFLPKDVNGQSIPGAFAAFVDDHAQVISITENPMNFEVGSHLQLGFNLSALRSDNGTFEVEINHINYLVGYQLSQGYREYKITDSYENKVIALIFSQS
ncbi:cache domain-containing protein [Thiosulfativibrio zosterae]|uniref:Cache domain-containing protein n=1 Tax=Thiosulfativibrio zosterae TaxID=2675053 RepID=A0A6F8PNM7_9GAMM|nr:cache domain-containing protein [Thiosulfativibrio zosterae]BBP43723.1 hypothetical protein THMIRHAT_14690 [Thiosulfativibrio zosterae]